MEENQQNNQGINNDAELAKQLQAEEYEGQQDDGAEQEYEEELDEESTKIYEAITLENMKTYLAQATALRIQKQFSEACNILRLILMKLTGLLGDELHPSLASIYYMMGEFFENLALKV